MHSKASLDRNLTLYLEKKYNKVFLTPEEVECETLVNSACVPSTSDKAHTWLLRDVVEFINKPYYSKELSRMNKRDKKEYVIKSTTEILNKLWKTIEKNDFDPKKLSA